MEGQRAHQALARIESAIARIEAASTGLERGGAPNGAEALARENRALRETMATTLREIDALIGKLGS